MWETNNQDILWTVEIMCLGALTINYRRIADNGITAVAKARCSGQSLNECGHTVNLTHDAERRTPECALRFMTKAVLEPADTKYEKPLRRVMEALTYRLVQTFRAVRPRMQGQDIQLGSFPNLQSVHVPHNLELGQFRVPLARRYANSDGCGT